MDTLHRTTGLDILRNAEIYVTKIGGDNAGKLRENTATVLERQAKGKKQILTVSAIRSSDTTCTSMAHAHARDRDTDGNLKEGFNTTSHLIAIAQCLRNGNIGAAQDILERIRTFLKMIVHAEVETDPHLNAETANASLDRVIDAMFDDLAAQIDSAGEGTLHALEKDWILQTAGGYFSITGVGERIAQALYGEYFALRNLSAGGIGINGLSEKVYGTDPEGVVEDERRADAAIATIRADMRRRLHSLLGNHCVLVAGGYLPVIASQRGYSDKTGALLAQATQDLGERVAYLIEKEYPIMSDDPRKNERARAIQEMTFTLAMELFGNVHGADGGAIHPDALNMLAEDDIDTIVFNPSRQQGAQDITYIHHYNPDPGGIEILASRQVPLAIQVSSTKMFGRPGFLSAVTAWFAGRGISIDQVSTSERTVSFTFNNGAFDEQTLRAFSTFLQETFGPDEELRLETRNNQSLIFCLGNNMRHTGPAARASMAIHMAGADIHFMTQGLNEQMMTFLIDREHVTDVRRKLHQLCVEMDGSTFAELLTPLRNAMAQEAPLRA